MASFKSALNICLSLVIIACPFQTFGHMGHDHGDEKVEVDPLWANAHILPLTQEVGVDLQWISSDKDTVTMKMTSKTEGYVSVGFCAIWHGTMQGCDIVLGWVDNQNGTTYLHDYHAPGNTIPTLDEVQDYRSVEGYQKDGITSITFTRKWSTGDDFNDADLEHNSVHVIYAWHPEDPTSPTQFHRHAKGSRGHTSAPVSFKDHKPGDHQEQSNTSGAGFLGSSLLCLYVLAHLIM